MQDKVTITLELTYTQASAVLALIQGTSPEPHSSPASHEVPSTDTKTSAHTNEPKKGFKRPDTTPVVNAKVKAAGKKTKMPGFGRSQNQIDEFLEHEEERFTKKTEEQLLKEQRKAEREAKKAEQEAVEAKAKQEVEEIKQKVVEDIKPSIPLLKKPWEL